MQIESTFQNKQKQKNNIFYSSSAVFLVLQNKTLNIQTEISCFNHFLLKRGISNVKANIVVRELDGTVRSKFEFDFIDPKVYTVDPCQNIEGDFIGSVSINFNSEYNIAVPFSAVVVSISSAKSVCALHTYGRALESKEIGTSIDLSKTKETGITLRDNENVRSFIVFHNGATSGYLTFSLEIVNYNNEKLTKEWQQYVNEYETVFIYVDEKFKNLKSILNNYLGHAKLSIDNLNGVFPRMMCGNMSVLNSENKNITYANEIQFTHTNFDFGVLSQPDAISSKAYFNHPDLLDGYCIFYPVVTDKKILINNTEFKSDLLQVIDVKPFKQLNIHSEGSNLPSRLISASVGKWPNKSVDSECSTGIFVGDYNKSPLHWHWGLLRPGKEQGNSIISIFYNEFDDNCIDNRELEFKIYGTHGLVFKKDIIIQGNQLLDINNFDLKVDSVDCLWFTLIGDNLEDLNIFATFYPFNDKSGFTEHAF